MRHIFQKFVEGLELPQSVRESLEKNRTNEELKNYTLSLPTLNYPDTSILAGRLYIYLNIKSCPKKIEDYVKLLDTILRSEIKEFMLKYKKESLVDKVSNILSN